MSEYNLEDKFIVFVSQETERTTLKVLKIDGFSFVFTKSFQKCEIFASGHIYLDFYTQILLTERSKDSGEVKNSAIHLSSPQEYIEAAYDDTITSVNYDLIFHEGSAVFGQSNSSLSPLYFKLNSCELTSEQKDTSDLHIASEWISKTEEILYRSKDKVQNENYRIIWICLSVCIAIILMLKWYATGNSSDDDTASKDFVINIIPNSQIDMNESWSICMIKFWEKDTEIDQSFQNLNQKCNVDTLRPDGEKTANSNEKYTRFQTVYDDENQSSEVNNHAQIVTLFECKHSFHKECLERWVKYSPSCPICRMNVWEQEQNLT